MSIVTDESIVPNTAHLNLAFEKNLEGFLPNKITAAFIGLLFFKRLSLLSEFFRLSNSLPDSLRNAFSLFLSISEIFASLHTSVSHLNCSLFLSRINFSNSFADIGLFSSATLIYALPYAK